MTPSGDPLVGGDARSRILAAAAELVAAGGGEAATTRAVAAAASVQAPTIYRLFGDKDGMLDAVAEQTLANFVADKARAAPNSDPIDDLRQGWETYVAFGLANPTVFALMNARPGQPSRAAAAGLAVLRDRVRRLARSGRLRVGEDRATDLIHAMGTGTVFTLLEKPKAERVGLSEAVRDIALAAVLGDPPTLPAATPSLAASSLRKSLDTVSILTPGERQLLGELLDRIARHP